MDNKVSLGMFILLLLCGAGSAIDTVSATPSDAGIDLEEGMNLISFPVTPSDLHFSEVIPKDSGINTVYRLTPSGGYIIIDFYEEQGWYDPGIYPEEPVFEEGTGYLVEAATDVTLVLSGEEYSIKPKNLVAGESYLIGAPYIKQKISDILGSCNASSLTIKTRVSESWVDVDVSSDYLEPGKGYRITTTETCEFGSTTADSDSDGIPDSQDACPYDAENYNGYQDEDGCPDTVPTQGDTTPPQLVDFSFTPTSIDTSQSSQKVTITFKATDDISGVDVSGVVWFASPSNSQQVMASAMELSRSNGIVKFQGTAEFPKYSEQGSWTVRYVPLSDNAGNFIDIDLQTMNYNMELHVGPAGALTCSDSDGGKNYYVKGTVKSIYEDPGGGGAGMGVASDKCDGDTLIEYYCDGNTKTSEEYVCPSGCSDGACIEAPPDADEFEGIYVHLNEKFDLKVEQSAKVVDYKYMKIALSEIPPVPCIALAGYKCPGRAVIQVAMPPAGRTLTLEEGKSAEVFGATITLLDINSNKATFIVRSKAVEDFVDIEIIPKEQTIVYGDDAEYKITIKDKHRGIICITTPCVQPVYTYQLDIGNLPFKKSYPKSITLSAGQLKTIALKVTPYILTKEVLPLEKSEAGKAASEVARERKYVTKLSKSPAIAGEAVVKTTPPEADTVPPQYQREYNFNVRAKLKGDPKVQDIDYATLVVRPEGPIKPPDFPKEEVTIKLYRGWNLVSIPGKLVKFNPASIPKKKLIASVYLKDEKRYVTLRQAKEILGVGFGEYLAKNAFWIYSYENYELSMEIDKEISFSGIALNEGWNLVPITEDMIGGYLGDIRENCEFERMYLWDVKRQEWTKISENYAFSSGQLNYGFILKSSNYCRLGGVDIALPACAAPVCSSGYIPYDTDGKDSNDCPIMKCIPSTIQSPVIHSVSGSTTLKVGETGTWTINASDPEQGTLTYSVVWGDEAVGIATEKASAPSTYVQTATFTHSYSKAGIYNPTFTVTDNQGISAKTSISVKVDAPFSIVAPIDFEDVSKGHYGRQTEPANYVINNEEKWTEIWGGPEIDFSKYTVIAVFMVVFPSGGNDIEIKNIVEHEDKIIVTVKKTYYIGVTAAASQPYHIVKIGKTNKLVVFED